MIAAKTAKFIDLMRLVGQMKLEKIRRQHSEIAHALSLLLTDPKHVCYSDCPCARNRRK